MAQKYFYWLFLSILSFINQIIMRMMSLYLSIFEASGMTIVINIFKSEQSCNKSSTFGNLQTYVF